jgi:3-oxoacyl-[acyl-carrier-protein] synthase-3
MNARIIGTGSYVPARVMTNFDLERMVDTTNEWIRTRTGIEERHLAADDEAVSDMAFHAAQRALAAAGVDPADLDLVVVATITADKITPSTACILQARLGAVRAACFDLQAACAGLLYGLELAQGLAALRPRYRKALVIGVEKLSMLTNWKDRNTCVLFGDGASALIVERSEAPTADVGGILATKLASNGDYAEILHVPAGGSRLPFISGSMDESLQFLTMQGQEVFKLAVTTMTESCREVLAEAGIDIGQIRWLIPHQANLRIIKAVGSRLGIAEDHVYCNVQKYGNTSAASIGIALDEIVRGGLVERGDLVLLTAFGAGLTWGAILVRW